jgi:hypothetical protein
MNANKKDIRAGLCPMEHLHFAAIATIIRDFGYPQERPRLAKHFAAELVKTNPKFDGQRFIAACIMDA